MRSGVLEEGGRERMETEIKHITRSLRVRVCVRACYQTPKSIQDPLALSTLVTNERNRFAVK